MTDDATRCQPTLHLQDAADEIANNVLSAFQKRNQSQQSLSIGLLVSSGSPIYKASPSKPSVELSEIDSPSLAASGGEELRSDSVAQLS